MLLQGFLRKLQRQKYYRSTKSCWLFEARKAKDSAIIAENDGQVVLKKRWEENGSIVPEDGAEPSNYLIPKGKHINFNQGEKIKREIY